MSNQIAMTYRRINHLVNSGGLSVTNSSQRAVRQRVVSSRPTVAGASANTGTTLTAAPAKKCFVCGESVNGKGRSQLIEMTGPHSETKLLTKVAQLIGENYEIIASPEDYVCSRCSNLMHYWDRLEMDMKRVRANVLNLLVNNYKALDGLHDATVVPPSKMLKVDENTAVASADSSNAPENLPRKSNVQQRAASTNITPTAVPKPPPIVAATGQQQQRKAASPAVVSQANSGTQTTVQRKTARMYNCTSCEYKTSDMRQFNSHYDGCKSQMFQCKTCKRTYQNFGLMKQHMVQEHGTPMDHTCSVCHVNYASDASLRKHMEANHATNVLVTNVQVSPRVEVKKVLQQQVTTPAAARAATPTSRKPSPQEGGPTYSCSHCSFTSNDKPVLEEHMRKHMAAKQRPFKCRLCSTRFESREEASIHARQHQQNFYRCAKCVMSFSRRELLVNHYNENPNHAPDHQTTRTESHAPNRSHGVLSKKPQQLTPKAPTPAPAKTTQKLLNETINEAVQFEQDSLNMSGLSKLQEDTNTDKRAAEDERVATQERIQFYACSICSLTFLQEKYYRQHMSDHHKTNEQAESVGKKSDLDASASGLLNDEEKATAGEKEQAEQGGDVDIEGYLEKMHADKTDGGLSFNITIPPAVGTEDGVGNSGQKAEATGSVGMDMPMLDQEEETGTAQAQVESTVREIKEEQGSSSGQVVSMPSLDDDTDLQQQQEAIESAADNTKTTITSEAQSTEPDTSEVGVNEMAETEVKIEEVVEVEHPSGEAQSEQGQSAATGSQKANDASLKNEETKDVQQIASDAEGEHVVSSAQEEIQEVDEHEGGGGEQQQQMAIELNDELRAQVESGQIKFIMHEDGHVLQLDNHIITDAEGNQILVEDPEHIQHLLQSVGVLQAGGSIDGEFTGEAGQMVLVQGENNEQQLIDASLLNSEGQLVIQQGDDENEGPHVISDDGRRIPISVSYTADGQAVVQVAGPVMEAEGEEVLERSHEDSESAEQQQHEEEGDASQHSGAEAATTVRNTGTSGGTFFALDDFIPQSENKGA